MNLRVVRAIGEKSKGYVVANGVSFKAAFGRGGFKRDKREGDGATPLFDLPLRDVFYRSERVNRPCIRMKTTRTKHGMRWDDDVKSATYNRLTRKELAASDEFLCRKDHLYNYIVMLGWNDRPVRKNKGSAIFWHGAREGYTPTAGCIATSLKDMRILLPRLTKHSRFIVADAPRKGRYRP
jgi:L,D-peptidoglycan transpeptidase YkuD (ErfK/YbiS/YcfS/YnhG family)